MVFPFAEIVTVLRRVEMASFLGLFSALATAATFLVSLGVNVLAWLEGVDTPDSARGLFGRLRHPAGIVRAGDRHPGNTVIAVNAIGSTA
jgi:hypothetical protein